MSGNAVNDDAANDAAGSTGEPTPEQRRALFRIVGGEPTDEELAALTAVLLAAASAPPPPAPRSRDRWSDPAARMRRPLTPGPGAWWASALPR